MPEGNRCASATMLPLASRLTCQQSSITTYWYPASFIPDFTIASAICLIVSSLTLQANLFQLFHPIGGVAARGAVCADTIAHNATIVTIRNLKKLIRLMIISQERAPQASGRLR